MQQHTGGELAPSSYMTDGRHAEAEAALNWVLGAAGQACIARSTNMLLVCCCKGDVDSPLSARFLAKLSPVCPPIVGRMASGRSCTTNAVGAGPGWGEGGHIMPSTSSLLYHPPPASCCCLFAAQILSDLSTPTGPAHQLAQCQVAGRRKCS
jgi:hypothetical protein